MNEGIHDVIGCDPLQGQGVREEGDFFFLLLAVPALIHVLLYIRGEKSQTL